MDDDARENGSLIPWVLVGVLLASLGGALWVGVPFLRDERASADAARREATQATARAMDAETARAALEKRLSALEEERLTRATELEQLQDTLKQREGELTALRAEKEKDAGPKSAPKPPPKKPKR